MEHDSGMKSKRRMLLGATCLFFIFLTACGVKSFDATTLELKNTGAIILHIVEDFDSSLYNFDEFTAYTENEINNYNATSQSVTLLSNELVDGKAKVVIQYSGDRSYYALNKKNLFFGTVEGAKNTGYNLVKKVNDVSTGETLMQADWNEMKSGYVIVLSESLNVVAPSEIIYASSGVNITGKKTATVNISEDFEFIICK